MAYNNLENGMLLEADDVDDHAGSDTMTPRSQRAGVQAFTSFEAQAWVWRKAFVLAALLGVGLVAVVAFMRPVSGNLRDVGSDSLLGLDETCAPLAWYKLEKVTHDNLADKGPGVGEEGIFYDVLETRADGTKRTVKLEVHALSPYNAHFKRLNGMSNGEGHRGDPSDLGMISEPYNNHIKLRFVLKDKATNKPFRPHTLNITAYDMDTAPGEDVKEYVIVHGEHKEYRSPDTELTKSAVPDGTKYTATKYGYGRDNAMDGLTLTAKQAAKAVTISYSCPESAVLTFGSTPGNPHTETRRDHIFGLLNSPPVITLPEGASTPSTSTAPLPTCSTFTCPSGYVADSEKSGSTDVSKDNCCDATCATFACPSKYVADDAHSSSTDVTQDNCCSATCATFSCPENFVANSEKSDSTDVAKDTCCQATCATFACPSGFVPDNTQSSSTEVTKHNCCDGTCASFSCPEGYLADKKESQSTDKETDNCCKASCSLFSCSSEESKIPNAEAVLQKEGSNHDVCCQSADCSDLASMTAMAEGSFCETVTAPDQCAKKFVKYKEHETDVPLFTPCEWDEDMERCKASCVKHRNCVLS